MYSYFLTVKVVIATWFLCWEVLLHERQKCFVLQDENGKEILGH